MSFPPFTLPEGCPGHAPEKFPRTSPTQEGEHDVCKRPVQSLHLEQNEAFDEKRIGDEPQHGAQIRKGV